VALAPIHTWVYNSTGRSLVSAFILRWSSTLAATLLPAFTVDTIGLAGG
jgi:hypothetical protein